MAPSPGANRRRAWAKAAIAAAAAVIVVVAASTAASAQTATTDTSPVNLSNNINMANGTAATQATVTEGDARFEVLAPEVIRMEYSPTGSFLNDPDLRHRRPQLHGPRIHQQRVRRLADDHHQPDDTQVPGRLGPVHRRQHPDAAARRAPAGRVRKRHPHLGMGVHLRPGLPGRRGDPQRRRRDRQRPQQLPKPARLHRRPKRHRRRRDLAGPRRASRNRGTSPSATPTTSAPSAAPPREPRASSSTAPPPRSPSPRPPAGTPGPPSPSR